MGGNKWGEVQRYFVEVVLNYDGKYCLLWPFYAENGYGRVLRRGRLVYVTREVLSETVGPPPSAIHEAAHSCGRGHLGCCSRNHLSWKTPVENEADKRLHGTDNRGEKSRFAKVSDQSAVQISLIRGWSQKDIAALYDLSQSGISRILKRVKTS